LTEPLHRHYNRIVVMGVREDYFRRIEKKRAEVDEMRMKLRMEERYLEAMLDTYKILPRSDSNGSAPNAFRRGSGASKAYEALKRVGHPMHVKELAQAIGLKLDRASTQGLASAIRLYLMKGEIFTKPAPNTYGLVEFGESEQGVNLLDAAKEP
jgi:hypothetical protein